MYYTVFSNPRWETFASFNTLYCVKQETVYFVICPKQGPKIEDVVLNRVCIVGLYFCPKQGQGFRPLEAPLHPNMGQVPPGFVNDHKNTIDKLHSIDKCLN